jgi:predicted enzyme related to lactoylglutathione lyase
MREDIELLKGKTRVAKIDPVSVSTIRTGEEAMIHSLYMVELTVADWPAAVAWYRDVLGLTLRMYRENDRFALFECATGRIALKQGEPQPGTTTLTFEVDSLDAELSRLESHSVLVVSPVKTSDEGYRRAIIHDPDGHPIVLFQWFRGGRGTA